MASAITEVLSVMSDVTAALTTAPLSYFFYASLATVAIGIFKELRNV